MAFGKTTTESEEFLQIIRESSKEMRAIFKAYFALLKIPRGDFRASIQGQYIQLRNKLSQELKLSEQYVQDNCEALTINHTLNLF